MMHTRPSFDQLMAPTIIPFPSRKPAPVNLRLWAALEREAREAVRGAVRLAPVSILQKESHDAR